MKRLLIPAIALILSLHPTQAAAYGGPSNIVIATNQDDGRLVVQGRVQLTRTAGQVAAPQNMAMARSIACTGCRTLAVAIQLDFASTGAGYVAPQNVAVAVSGSCNGCVTVAKAVQVFYTVDDLTQIPPEITDAMRTFDRDMVAISTDRSLTMSDAEARVDAVIARFQAMAIAYDQQRQVVQ